MSITPLDEETPLGADLAQALHALRSAADRPTWPLAEADVRAGVQQLALVGRLAEAQVVRLAAEAQQRGLPGQGGHRRLAGWIGEVLPTSTGGEARRLSRRAEALYAAPVAAELGPTRDAALAGQVSGSQADAISAALARLVPPSVPAGAVPAQAVAQAQDLLLGRADLDDADGLAVVGQRLVAVLDPDADDRLMKDEAAREHARGLTLATLRSGLVHVEGTLTPDCGAAVRAAVDAWSAPQPSFDGSADLRTAAQRRHDGLHRLAQEALARPGLLPSSHGSPYRVVTVVGVEALAAALSGQPAQGVLPATLPDGTPLSSAALAQIACGADLVPVLVDGHGNPLDVGDTQYSFTAKQRTAIALRDRHCTYPGCGAPPAWCDVRAPPHAVQPGRPHVGRERHDALRAAPPARPRHRHGQLAGPRPGGLDDEVPTTAGGTCAHPRHGRGRAAGAALGRAAARVDRQTRGVDLEAFDQLAQSLDGIRRGTSGGAARWSYRGRLVARALDATHVVVRVPFDVRDSLVHEDAEAFDVPTRFAKHQKVVVDLDRATDAAVERAVVAAWDLQQRE
ncbi:hypothetical protein GCM10027446_18490 [Angustibacter peucedani]